VNSPTHIHTLLSVLCIRVTNATVPVSTLIAASATIIVMCDRLFAEMFLYSSGVALK